MITKLNNEDNMLILFVKKQDSVKHICLFQDCIVVATLRFVSQTVGICEW